MATQSFYEDLVLRTPEAVKNLEKAIEIAEKRGRLVVEAQGPVTDPEEIKRIVREIEESLKREE